MIDENKAFLPKLESISSYILSNDGKDYNSDAFQQFTDSGVCHLLNSCHSLKFIESDCVPNISHLTIDLLIAKAVNNPKNEFYIHLGRDPKTNKNSNQAISDIISQSLVVKYESFCSFKKKKKKIEEL